MGMEGDKVIERWRERGSQEWEVGEKGNIERLKERGCNREET